MPFKNKEDYNKWRRDYRKKQHEKGKCMRCYRPMIEESGKTVCINCVETKKAENKFRKELYRGF